MIHYLGGSVPAAAAAAKIVSASASVSASAAASTATAISRRKKIPVIDFIRAPWGSSSRLIGSSTSGSRRPVSLSSSSFSFSFSSTRSWFSPPSSLSSSFDGQCYFSTSSSALETDDDDDYGDDGDRTTSKTSPVSVSPFLCRRRSGVRNIAVIAHVDHG